MRITVNDFSMPALGFGTYQLEGETAYRLTRFALEVGYRHIDTAQLYENETEVGRAIKESGVDRSEIFVTTKVWVDRFQASELSQSITESLHKLGLESVDLVLLHWPNPSVPLAETLTALMQAKQQGQAQAIGLSNFTTALMEQAVQICGPHQLVTNQVEYHPFLWQDSVIAKARELTMTVTAYRPLAKGNVLQNDTLNSMAAKYGKSPTQIALRWILQQQIAAIPRSSREDHARENFDVFDFALTVADMAEIDALRGNLRLASPSHLAPAWDPIPV